MDNIEGNLKQGQLTTSAMKNLFHHRNSLFQSIFSSSWHILPNLWYHESNGNALNTDNFDNVRTNNNPFQPFYLRIDFILEQQLLLFWMRKSIELIQFTFEWNFKVVLIWAVSVSSRFLCINDNDWSSFLLSFWKCQIIILLLLCKLFLMYPS